MAQICPRCGGKEAGCPICHLPPKRVLPKQNKVMATLYKIYLPIIKKVGVAQNWPVTGVDLSSWNGVMDLSITKSKTQYGFIRIGYGEGYKDYRCDTYRQDALNIKWPYGVYWFCYPGYSWTKHAEGLADVANEFPYQLDMVIDAEITYLGKEATLDWFINMDNRVYELTGKRPMIYTSMGFWNEKVARSNYFASRRNWVAHWTYAQAPITPLDMPLWGHWQWEADGNRKAKEYGMIRDGDADMDMDRYYGTPQQFAKDYNLEPPEPPIIPPEIKPIKYVIINTAGLNMRSLPDASSVDIGTLQQGDDVPVTDEQNGLYKIEGWISKDYTKPK